MTVQEILTNIVNQVRTGIPNNVKSSNVRALLTWMTRRMDAIEPGRLTWVKASGNTSIDPEAGDRATGIIENVFVRDAVYLGGDISLLSSYTIYTVEQLTINNLPFILYKNKAVPNNGSGIEDYDTIFGSFPDATAPGGSLTAFIKYLGGESDFTNTDFNDDSKWAIFTGY